MTETPSRRPPVEAPPAARIGAGQLHRVGGVDGHRNAERLHLADAQHVHHQVVIAERGAPFAQDHLGLRRGLGDLGQDIPAIPRRQELPLLDVQPAAGAGHGAGRRHHQIGLAAQEGGNLHHVGDVRRRLGLIDLVDVRGDGNVDLGLHPGQHRQSRLKSRSPVAVDGRAVGLVEAGLEHEGQTQAGGDRLQFPRGVQGQIGVFEHVQPGDQSQRPAAAYGDAPMAKAHGVHIRSCVRRDGFIAEPAARPSGGPIAPPIAKPIEPAHGPERPDALQELLGAASGARIACVGDLMLDRYVTGEGWRESPRRPRSR